MCYAYFVKNACKNFRVWIIGAALTVVGVGVPFLVLVITLNIEDAAPFQYPLLLAVFAAIYVLIGFIWGDLHCVAYRRREKKWDDPLPQEIKDSAWVRRLPFYSAAAVVFTVFISFEIIFWITGGYPFL